MRLYHGSTVDIQRIDLALSKPNKDFQNMKEEIVKDLIARLMEDRGLSMQQAFDAVYTSRLFEKLSDPNTGLFFQSSGYVYGYLMDEMQAVKSDKSM